MRLHKELDGDFSVGIDKDGSLFVVDAKTFEIVFTMTDALTELSANDSKLSKDILIDIGHLMRFEAIGSRDEGMADGRASITEELQELLGIARVENSIERLITVISRLERSTKTLEP